MIETSATKNKQAEELVAKAARIDDKAFMMLGGMAFCGLMVMMVVGVTTLSVVATGQEPWLRAFTVALAVIASAIISAGWGAGAALKHASKMRKEAAKIRDEAGALEAGELEMLAKKATAARVAERAVEEAEMRDKEQREREERQLAAAAASDAREAQARAAEAERLAKIVQDTKGQRSGKNAQAAQNPGYRESEGRNKPGGSSGRAKEL